MKDLEILNEEFKKALEILGNIFFSVRSAKVNEESFKEYEENIQYLQAWTNLLTIQFFSLKGKTKK
jgi:hypothetical protein